MGASGSMFSLAQLAFIARTRRTVPDILGLQLDGRADFGAKLGTLAEKRTEARLHRMATFLPLRQRNLNIFNELYVAER